MISRFLSLTLAFFIGVPLCWCCSANAAAPEPAACPACESADPGSGSASTPTSPLHDRPCCTGSSHERNLSPDVAAAPRLVLVDLQVWVRLRPEDLLPPQWRELTFSRDPADAQDLSPTSAPLYQRHCALLI